MLNDKCSMIYMFSLLKKLPRNLRLVLTATFALLVTLSLPVLSAEELNASQLAQQGQTLYEAGQLEQAIASWQQAASAYQQQGDLEQSRANLLNKATAQQNLGIYQESCSSVLRAFDLDTNCIQLLEEVRPLEQQLQGLIPVDAEHEATAFSSLKPLLGSQASTNKTVALLRLGDYLRYTDYPNVAGVLLIRSQETAQTLKNPNREAAVALSLGNTYRYLAQQQQNRFPPQTIAFNALANSKGNPEEVLKIYQPAVNTYQQAAEIAPSALGKAKAQLNELSLLLDTWEFWQSATSYLSNNLEELGINDPDFRQEIQADSLSLQLALSERLQPQIVSLSENVRSLLSSLPQKSDAVRVKINFAESLMRQNKLNRNTAEVLVAAITDAQQIGDLTAEAEANGFLGSLYEKRQQYPEAQKLTETALKLAPTAQHPEIAYRWHAQLGGILAQEGDRSGALSAYESSFSTIQALRSDLATTPVEPILRRYISLLLKEEPTSEQLSQARNVLESLQISELDNFFSDPCSDVANEPIIIDDVDRSAAVIYPIVLEDSLEVILTVPGQPLQLYSTSITPEEVNTKIAQLRRLALSNPGFAEEYRGARGNPQQQQQIRESQTASLQQDFLPLAQEIYSWLLEPAEASLVANQVETLVFVLDGSLRSIPMAILHDGEQYLIEKDYNIALTSGLQLTNPKPLKRQSIKVLAAGTTNDFPKYDFPPIPQVEKELTTIKNIFDNSEILLNEDFTPTSLQSKLAQEDYPVVHLATHGQFGSTSEQTFILSGAATDDDARLINVKQLDSLLRNRSLDRDPIELLVLSACNTAEGDSEAILGLAGVAVRAGAQSTVATLWGANDDATAELMSYFYRNLAQNSSISKAKALRLAQLELIRTEDSNYSHPYYWAPFVLIGNWL